MKSRHKSVSVTGLIPCSELWKTGPTLSRKSRRKRAVVAALLNFMIWGLGLHYIGVKGKTVFAHLGGNLSAYAGLLVYGETQQSIIDVQWLALAYFSVGGYFAYIAYKECRMKSRLEAEHSDLPTLGACDT